MRDAFIIDAIRTPVGKIGGTLSAIRADDLAALVIAEILKRNPRVDVQRIEDVVMGCANQAGEDNRNVARMALLLAGVPHTVPGETVNRLCASGLSAAVNAARAIATGDGDLFVAGGVEHMTRAPYVVSKPSHAFGRDAQMHDTSLGWRFVNPKMLEMFGAEAMGETAENVAEKYKVSREDQDKFAFWSQTKAARARREGRFDREIMPVEIPRRKAEPIVFKYDEYIREDTSLEKLAKLRPAFRSQGTVTAGNASGLNDGACALLLAGRDACATFEVAPRARMVSSGVVGVEPSYMGMGPVGAIRKALDRARLSLEQIDVIEINEAFAAQCLACMRELGLSDDDERVNPNGGAIALGHPLGMSGARLLCTAVNELEHQKKRYALCALCVGVGQGMAAVIERVA